MDYNHITNFLSKFKVLINQKEELKEIIVKTISEEISHPIEPGSVKTKGNIIYVSGSPALRNEIMIHKKKILVKLESLLPPNRFIDIK